MGDGQTRFGDGSVYVKTVFRMIVFRPFVGEVLVGWVASCSAEGIKVKTDFFDSIQIPHAMLWDTCEFVADEQAWKWKSDGGDLFIDQNEKIRFRVEKEVFQVAKPEEGVSPYTIIGSCQQDGMGLVAWWQ